MKRGEIYYADAVRPLSGGPLQDRRVIIITETEDIIMDNPIYVVACSSRILEHEKARAVELPFHPRKSISPTGFTRPTWAFPDWILELRPSDLRDYHGIVPVDKLRQIAALLPFPIVPINRLDPEDI